MIDRLCQSDYRLSFPMQEGDCNAQVNFLVTFCNAILPTAM